MTDPAQLYQLAETIRNHGRHRSITVTDSGVTVPLSDLLERHAIDYARVCDLLTEIATSPRFVRFEPHIVRKVRQFITALAEAAEEA